MRFIDRLINGGIIRGEERFVIETMNGEGDMLNCM